MTTTTDAPTLSRAMAEAAAEIDQALDILLPPEEGPEAPLFAAMRYAAIGGGKRLRGFLVLEGARQFGVSRQAALRVAGEDRRRLVEGAMDARLAAAQVVVVHRRQVVVNERVAMQELDRGAGLHDSGVVAAEEAGGLDDEERPQALAAGERRVPHRRHQPRRAGDLARTRRVG